ncbi:hypothetical protein [Streptomyces sp. NK08204]|uniref:hypothetical protein n=1 Tax=Streptomyces sp. NK08204 TaxID=2873260 RepID=UPI001CEC4D3A|nr:hypothetical protein [Streptomyces sp. NK08204]
MGYESWLERDCLILLDRDPEVVEIASQPFWLHWQDGQEQRRHAPDYFVRLADGRARVVDVRSADRLDERTGGSVHGDASGLSGGGLGVCVDGHAQAGVHGEHALAGPLPADPIGTPDRPPRHPA